MSKGARGIDPYCQAVYTWEDSWPGWGRNSITLAACRRLIRTACARYKTLAPTVVKHEKESFSWSMPRIGRISIRGGPHNGRGGLNVATALHEAAHCIAWHLHGERIQDHGPTFLRIYLDLLVRARVAPELALKATARSFGLKC